LGSIRFRGRFDTLREGLLAERPQMSVERCRIIPEGRVHHVGHHLDVGMSQTSFVLIDGGGFDESSFRASRTALTSSAHILASA
jgi:hypothetical protein